MNRRLVVLFLLTLALSFSVGRADEAKLAEILKRVQQNESHYQNLAFEFREDYRQFDPPMEPGANLSEALADTWSLCLHRVLLKGTQFRVEKTKESLLGVLAAGGGERLPDRLQSESEMVQVYDGKTHQRLDESKHWPPESLPDEEEPPQRSGLISAESPRLFNYARPHMFLLSSGCPQIPLSVYLQGHEAVLKRAGSDFSKRNTLQITHLGQEQFNGFTCERVYIDNLVNGTRHNGWELWLAGERNYIPVRRFGFTYRWSPELPVAEAEVLEWQEVKPDVWFPIKARTVRYHSSTVQQQRIQKITWTKEVTVAKVEVNPEVAENEFRELEFPTGTKIRIQEEDQPPRFIVEE